VQLSVCGLASGQFVAWLGVVLAMLHSLVLFGVPELVCGCSIMCVRRVIALSRAGTLCRVLKRRASCTLEP
jgi:hypothetical protein